MKSKYTILILLLFLTVGVFAQTPEKINYQAVARDLSGNPLTSQAIAVIIEVRQGSASGSAVYKEAHAVTTNAFGLFTLEIGGGTPLGGNFSTINWGTSSYYLYIEVDGNPIGASQLLSVPYALYAKKSLNGGAGNDTSIIDSDGDTYINVEASPDQDVIHFNLGNSTGYPTAEYFTMIGPRLEVINSGESIFIGEGAGQNDNLAANQNVFIGKNSGNSNTSGYANSAIGLNSFQNNTTGSGNIAFGLNSLRDNVSGFTNVALGNGALRDHVSGDDNVAIGFVSLDVNSSGVNNTSIGTRSGFSNFSGSGNVFLGHEAGYSETGSNKLYIQNSRFSAPLIYGDFANDSLHVNGVLKVNDGTQGLNKVLTSDAFGNASWQLPSASGDNWGSQVVISAGSNISGDGTVGNPLSVTDSVNDADADPNNERISTFTLNTTSDSLVIIEAGVRHTFPLSSLSDGDWTRGSGVLYNTSDNVGIGTLTPNHKLQIVDNIPGHVVNIKNTDNQGTSSISFDDDAGAGKMYIGYANTGYSFSPGHSYINSDNDIVVATQNSEAMRVSVGGNIGIGISSPTTKLHLDGTLRLDNLAGPAPAIGNVLTSVDALGNAQWQPLPSLPAAFWSSTNVGSIHPTVLTDNVGIGTNNATSPLTINTKIGNEIEFIGGFNSDILAPSQLNFKSGGLSLFEAASFNFNTASTNRMTILNNGRVGIGISTPVTDLDIYGTDGIQLNVAGSAGNIGGIAFRDGYRTNNRPFHLGIVSYDHSTGGTGFSDGLVISGYDGIAFTTDNSATSTTALANVRMMINQAGNVGIGVPNPIQKLDVAGNVSATNHLYSTPKTRYLTIGESDFRLARSSDGEIESYYGQGGVGVVNATSGQAILVAPVYLPQGAVVTNIQVFYVDNSTASMDFNFIARGLNSTSRTVLSTVTSVGNTSAVQSISLTGTTINNQLNSYAIHVYSTGWPSANIKNMDIKTVKITYTITETD